MFLLPLLALSSLASCGGETGGGEKTFLDMGRLFDAAADSHFEDIAYGDLQSMAANGESFLLLVYDDRSSCECWAVFRNTIYSFMEERNAKVYALTVREIDSSNEFGIDVVSDTETIAIFDKGKLKEQRYRVGTEDSFATDPDYFLYYMDERLEYSPLLEVNDRQLEELYGGGGEFTVYYGRSGCSDCSFVEGHFLSGFFERQELADFYYYDLEPLRDDAEAYQAFKDEVGLSEKGNPGLGYGEGVVPTFFHVNPAGGTTKAEMIDDACVYLNNTVALEDGKYVVADSFYSQNRLEYLESLPLSNVEPKVLEGIEIPEEDIISSGERFYWKNSAAAVYADPILEVFLLYYLAL